MNSNKNKLVVGKYASKETTFDDEYDIGLVCMMNLNIGNNMTNYALYQYLSDLNYNVLLISNPFVGAEDFPDRIDERLKLFRQPPYPISNMLEPPKNKWELIYANQVCDKFVLGSDQLWRELFVNRMDYFTCLDWAESSKSKIAYGTSFGTANYEGNPYVISKMGYLLKRFQDISVREQDGVKILKELCNIEAECVLDPVFLCEKIHYEEMADIGRDCLPENKYVATYLLDITEEKEDTVLSIANLATGGVYMAITEPYITATSDCKLKFTQNPFNELWLAMIQSCEFFVTDSFHGICFALIFQKQFCVVFNKENWRGISRIHSLLNLLDLDSRLVENYDYDKIQYFYRNPIDYDKLNQIIYAERRRSKEWLKTALQRKEYCKGGYNTHDFTWDLVNNIQQLLREEIRVINYRTRNDLFIAAHSVEKNSVQEWRKKTGNVQVVGWGAGGCFRRNVHYIKSFCDMKYVCDSNSEKWGKELEEHVICISPKMLLELGNVMVIIMVDSAGTSFQIAEKLLEYGISNYEHVENWLAFVEGK